MRNGDFPQLCKRLPEGNSQLPQPYIQVTAGAKIWAALVAARTSWATVHAPRDSQGWWRMSWTFLQGVLRPHPSVTWLLLAEVPLAKGKVLGDGISNRVKLLS